MRRKRHIKHKVFFIIGILVAIIILSFMFFYTICSKISYSTLYFDKSKEKLYLNDSLLWDTGASGSSINEEYKDKISNKTQIGYSLVFDTFHKMKLRRFYYSSQFNPIMHLNINNFFFTLRNQPKEMKQENEIGGIGMDIISKTNWIIDFSFEKIEILPQNKTYETKDIPQLNFKYKRKYIPKTQLDFSVCQLKNVLIDAGSNGEITLLKSDIEKINKKYKPVTTLIASSYGVHSSEPTTQNGYVYDSLKINNIYFNNIQIIEGNKRVIGFRFFKRFDKVYLNTKERRFYFY